MIIPCTYCTNCLKCITCRNVSIENKARIFQVLFIISFILNIIFGIGTGIEYYNHTEGV